MYWWCLHVGKRVECAGREQRRQRHAHHRARVSGRRPGHHLLAHRHHLSVRESTQARDRVAIDTRTVAAPTLRPFGTEFSRSTGTRSSSTPRLVPPLSPRTGRRSACSVASSLLSSSCGCHVMVLFIYVLLSRKQ